MFQQRQNIGDNFGRNREVTLNEPLQRSGQEFTLKSGKNNSSIKFLIRLTSEKQLIKPDVISTILQNSELTLLKETLTLVILSFHQLIVIPCNRE